MPILVCPLSRVNELAAARRPGRIISLLDPNTPFPEAPGVTRRLQLSLHDILEEQHGWSAPQAAHVREVLTFIEDWDRSDPLLVHCYAGISRSTATAFITACVHNPSVDEEAIALALRAASHTAWPNRRLVALADAELGRSGRMLRALDRIGQGKSWSEIGEAEPFELASRFDTAA